MDGKPKYIIDEHDCWWTAEQYEINKVMDAKFKAIQDEFMYRTNTKDMTFKKEMEELVLSDFKQLEEQVCMSDYNRTDNMKQLDVNDKSFNLVTEEVIYQQPDQVQEFILCSAINFYGIIISGKRHENCYDTFRRLTKFCDYNVLDEPGRKDQGFLTSLNRFVDRKEAWKIALANNQIKYGLSASNNNDDPNDNILISENLY